MASYEDTLDENCSPKVAQLLCRLNGGSFMNAPLRLRPTREELLSEFTTCREELTPMLEEVDHEEKSLEKSLVTQLPTQLPPMSVRLAQCQQIDDSPRLESKSRSCCF